MGSSSPQDGSRQYMGLQASQVRSWVSQVQGLQQRPWSHQEIPLEPLPAVLPRVRQGHRLPEAGLDPRPACPYLRGFLTALNHESVVSCSETRVMRSAHHCCFRKKDKNGARDTYHYQNTPIP